MSKEAYERHWQTQALVDALSAIASEASVPYEELSRMSGVPVEDIRERRLQSAKKIVERDHHILIDTIRGFGVRRLTQEDIAVPLTKRRTRMRGAARRNINSIRDGITDFEKLPVDVRSAAYTHRAVAGAVLQATSYRSEKLLKQHTSNGELNIGRTLELLKEK
jgi:hypothetical protein